MPFTREQLNPLYDKFFHKEKLEHNISLSYQYLTGKLKQLPEFTKSDANYQFSKLYELTLQPDITPEDKALVFSLLKSPHILHHVKQSVFEQTFNPLIKKRDDQVAFDKALALMNELDVTEEEMLNWYFQNSMHSYNKEDIFSGSWPVMNFLHSCFVKMSDDDIDKFVIQQYFGGFDSQVFYFLYHNRREKAYEYVEKRIISEKRINWVVLAAMLDMEYERYLPRCLEIIEHYRDKKEMLWAYLNYLQLNDYVKENNIKELLIRSEEYFEYYINTLGKYSGNYWSRIYNMGLRNGVTMPLHGWAVYFTLTNDDAKGKKMLEQLLAKLVVLKEDVLKMLKHVLGPGAIPYVLTAIFQKEEKNDERRRLEYIFDELVEHMGQFDLNSLWQFDKYENKDTLNEIIKFLISYAYAENYIKYDLRTSHSNQDILKMLLQTDFEQFGPKIVAIAQQYRDKELFHAGFRTYFTYNECAPVKDTGELINWSEQYITDYLKKPEEHHSGFSSVVYYMGYAHPTHGFYMPAHGWALYFILTDNEFLGKGLLDELVLRGKAIHYNVLRMLRHVLGAGAIPYMLNAVYERDDNRFNEENRLKFIFDELAAFKGQYDMNVLWEFRKYANKQAESGVIRFLVEQDSEVVAKAIKSMDDKKKEKRLMAARILLALDAPEARETLHRALDKEPDDETRDLIYQICGKELAAPATEETVAAMVASATKRGKLKKPVFTWLDEAALPALYFKWGRQLAAGELRLVLYRMSRAKGIRTDAEIKPVLQLIDKERSGDFAKAIYKEFEEKGFDAKYKFLLLLAAVFGNDEMVNKFCAGINKWIEANRKVMCEYGVDALALQGSNKALRWIEWYSRKFRSKKAYISEAAEKALTAAAEELEISIHELGDRIVPDFGFEGLFKHFTVNGEEYRAFIDSNFKLAYFKRLIKQVLPILTMMNGL